MWRDEYISIETLLKFCDNSKDHSITPNDFLRMDSIRILKTKKRLILLCVLTMVNFFFAFALHNDTSILNFIVGNCCLITMLRYSYEKDF